MANLGLYEWKYPARRLIQGLLPLCKNINPNYISWSMLPVGVLVGCCLTYGLQGSIVCLFLTIPLTFLRMFLGTIDGLIAEYFNKRTAKGEILNRLMPELCDLFYLLPLAYYSPLIGILLMSVVWLTTFSGLIGFVAKKPIQSIGPVGQTDRLAAFLIFIALTLVSHLFGWNIDLIKGFIYWSLIGGVCTILLRLNRTLKEASHG